jgi:hypothetical protein
VEPSPAVLTVLGKPDCHLCHVMADVARRAAAEFQAAVVERDVREDADLFARYEHDIPVLLYDGHELFRHRVSEADLRSRLASLGIPPR